MNNLKGEVKVFTAIDSDSYYTTQMDKHLPAKQRLELKIGAQVNKICSFEKQFENKRQLLTFLFINLHL